MKISTVTAIVGLAVSFLPFSYSHTPFSQNIAKRYARFDTVSSDDSLPLRKRATRGGANQFRYLTPKSKPFFVNGKSIPEVSMDQGESYSGLLPISKSKTESRKLFFWFFPKIPDPDATPQHNLEGEDTIVIWLNGGPGCSSLAGLLQENGPFLWQPGTVKMINSAYTWTYLSNVLWVEQPVGTGFSQGAPNIHSSEEAAEQFLGFFENFLDTFQLYNKKIYITGESYAGVYVPYIADAFYKRKALAKQMKSQRGESGILTKRAGTKYYDLRGTLIYDPLIADFDFQSQVAAYPLVKYWEHIFALGSETMSKLEEMHQKCGYKALMDKYLTFPPPKDVMLPFSWPYPENPLQCNIFVTIYNATIELNPCFDATQIGSACPPRYDPLGSLYTPPGLEIYFNRTDVKKAIHAPLDANWQLCSGDPVFVNSTDTSEEPIFHVLPRVIEKSERTVIAHGMLDYVLPINATLLAIQNMTWAGMKGFQKPPQPESLVLNEAYSIQRGIFGKAHTERGLTWVEVEGAGNMGPASQPVVAFKLMEYLLGRRNDL